MNLRKIISAALGALALGATLTAPSRAQQQTFAGVNALGNGYAYSSTTGFSVPGPLFFSVQSFPAAAASAQLATVTFTGLTNNGYVTNTTGSTYAQNLDGGTFVVTAASPGGAYAQGTVLLEGSFSSAVLSGSIGSTTGGIQTQFNNVTYGGANNGGVYFTSSGLFSPGAFSIGLTSITPALSLVGSPGGQRFSDFVASGAGTFSAATVAPEPGMVSFASLSGLSLLGLLGRARFRRRTGGPGGGLLAA